MSDHSISIVPQQSEYPNSQEKATEILAWLVSLDIVKPTLSDCVLGADHGYAISEGAKKISCNQDTYVFNLIPNGLEITLDKRVFHTGENGLEEIICPYCNQNCLPEEWDFISVWSNGEDHFTCSVCEYTADIHEFRFAPEWGFSNLGFTFWNWPDFTDAFLTEFSHRLGCRINKVYEYL